MNGIYKIKLVHEEKNVPFLLYLLAIDYEDEKENLIIVLKYIKAYFSLRKITKRRLSA